jgi:hypothetical protein
MDLRNYYSRIREIEQAIESDHVVIVSEATPDGGKPGMRTEVSRFAAAKMIAERRARLATAEEAEVFRTEAAESVKRIEQEKAASRMQITVLSEPEMRQVRDKIRPQKG